MNSHPLSLHVGAHRTGTSSFQMCLHDNRERIAESGWSTAYPGRDGVPSGQLALRLPGPKEQVNDAAVSKAARTLSNHSKDRPLILSEENITGRMMHFMQGRFYPAAKVRCGVLRAAWSGPIAHVVLVIRPYDQLFASGFRKRAEDNPVPPFDTLRPKYMDMDRGWPEVVEILRDELRAQQLTVIPYSDRGTSVSLLQRLVPSLADLALQEPSEVVNLSATDAALEALQIRYRAGETLDRAAWKEVIQHHADDHTPRGFAAFSQAEQTIWTERYMRDVDRIARLDGVTFG